MMGRFLATGVTFGVFMTEAIIHYNLGKTRPGESFRLSLPPPRELAKIAVVTGAFSIASGALIGALERRTGRRP